MFSNTVKENHESEMYRERRQVNDLVRRVSEDDTDNLEHNAHKNLQT